MNRNPYAPNTALTLGDVQPGVKLHFYVPGSKDPAKIEILSRPFPRFRLDAGRQRLLAIKARCGGIDDTLFLEELGIVPDRRGRWSRNYCVRA